MHWSQADSWQVHPAYDANLNSADMATVFLDRKPPFDPLPLYRNRVGSGIQMTISGWGSNSAPTPTTGAGSGGQRTGRTITVGSPTAAAYHPDDPNPGMLDPAVRQTVLKTNGAAPWSNGCFGDSGGPIIYNQFGQDYVAGVGYFTGLSCEDYNLWTRLDPFLPFLDVSYKRGGQDLVKATLACVTPNPQGTLTAIFGYQDDNGVGISIPFGVKNASARDTSGLRPTRFDPGTHPFAFGVDFTAGQTASWTLSPDNNPSVTRSATSATSACTAAQAVDSGCVLQCRAAAFWLHASRRLRQLRAVLRRDRARRGGIHPWLQRRARRLAELRQCNATRRCQLDCSFVDDTGIYGKGPQATACTDGQTAYTNCLFFGEGDE